MGDTSEAPAFCSIAQLAKDEAQVACHDPPVPASSGRGPTRST
jgi:hypothetical protein